MRWLIDANQSALEILNSYNSPTLHKVNKAALSVLKVLTAPLWGLPYLLFKGLSLATKYIISCITREKPSSRILKARERAMETIYKEGRRAKMLEIEQRSTDDPSADALVPLLSDNEIGK